MSTRASLDLTTPAESFAAPPMFDPERYAAWFETELGRLVWQDERAALVPLIGAVEGRLILDAGVGPGRFALDLARMGARVTGLDAAEPMLHLANRFSAKSGLSLRLTAGRLEALPFAGGTFDTVVAVTALCFVTAPALAVREFARVLKPGGRFVVGELGRWSLWAARRRLSRWRNARWKHARFWTVASLAQLSRDAGLSPAGAASAVFYPPNAWAGRMLRPVERRLARRHTAVGAAFIALAAEKPGTRTTPEVLRA